MKKIEVKDLKPGFHWLKDRKDGSFAPVRVYEGYGGHLYYLLLGNECEEHVRDDDQFFELITPVDGEINLVRNEYDGESIVDMGRDISECLDSDFNPSVNLIPEMAESPGFWAGKFVVDITWVPDEPESEQDGE
ncbi:hypothetical protein S21ZY_123 [Pseudomonas phage ZY21]|nr:hypothetical protein S21ZY_123 [Pseudomonas phage ZY21]